MNDSFFKCVLEILKIIALYIKNIWKFFDYILKIGGLEALAQLIVINNSVLGDRANNYHLTVRRYACMALTNLTFGISENKALLCSITPVLMTLSNFLSSFSEEVKQVISIVFMQYYFMQYSYQNSCLIFNCVLSYTKRNNVHNLLIPFKY